MGYTISDNDNRHNGWTNYATWRVNLEIFDGMGTDYFRSEIRTGDTYGLSKRLQEFAENVITDFESKDGLAVDYALAFLGDVNWYEIAEHMIEAEQEEAA